MSIPLNLNYQYPKNLVSGNKSGSEDRFLLQELKMRRLKIDISNEDPCKKYFTALMDSEFQENNKLHRWVKELIFGAAQGVTEEEGVQIREAFNLLDEKVGFKNAFSALARGYQFALTFQEQCNSQDSENAKQLHDAILLFEEHLTSLVRAYPSKYQNIDFDQLKFNMQEVNTTFIEELNAFEDHYTDRATIKKVALGVLALTPLLIAGICYVWFSGSSDSQTRAGSDDTAVNPTKVGDPPIKEIDLKKEKFERWLRSKEKNSSLPSEEIEGTTPEQISQRDWKKIEDINQPQTDRFDTQLFKTSLLSVKNESAKLCETTRGENAFLLSEEIEGTTPEKTFQRDWKKIEDLDANQPQTDRFDTQLFKTSLPSVKNESTKLCETTKRENAFSLSDEIEGTTPEQTSQREWKKIEDSDANQLQTDRFDTQLFKTSLFSVDNESAKPSETTREENASSLSDEIEGTTTEKTFQRDWEKIEDSDVNQLQTGRRNIQLRKISLPSITSLLSIEGLKLTAFSLAAAVVVLYKYRQKSEELQKKQEELQQEETRLLKEELDFKFSEIQRKIKKTREKVSKFLFVENQRPDNLPIQQLQKPKSRRTSELLSSIESEIDFISIRKKIREAYLEDIDIKRKQRREVYLEDIDDIPLSKRRRISY